MNLTEKQSDILVALATYKFLTVSQLMTLGIMNDRANLNHRLAPLREGQKPLIQTLTFGISPEHGRLESVHHLTDAGKKVLVEDLGLDADTVRLPKGSGIFYKDYFHRKHTIDFQIAVYQETAKEGVGVVFFDTYFDKVGSNRKAGNLQAKTKIDLENGNYLIADAIYMLQRAEGSQELYCAEIYNGIDTGRTLRQLRQHAEALGLGTPSLKYNFDKANRVICVMESEAALEAIQRRVLEDPYFHYVKEFFRFITHASELKNPKMIYP